MRALRQGWERERRSAELGWQDLSGGVEILAVLKISACDIQDVPMRTALSSARELPAHTACRFFGTRALLDACSTRAACAARVDEDTNARTRHPDAQRVFPP